MSSQRPPDGAAFPPLPPDGWTVGEAARAAVPLDPAARRAARLDARLAVYAQHAAAMAEEAAATLAADAARIEAHAATRAAAAEHFLELQATGSASPAVGGDAPPFDAFLSDALLELEHQAAVDLALRQRLVALRDAVARGASWAAAPTPPLLPAPAADGSAPPVGGGGAVGVGAEDLDDDAPVRALESGLVSARADGVGGALAGHYPGVATRVDATAALGAAERAGGGDAAGVGHGPGRAPGRVDLRF